MQFQFPESKKRPIEIKNSKGEVLKEYFLDMGNAEMLKKALENFKALDAMNKKLKTVDIPSSEELDLIIERQKSIVNDLLSGDYELYWNSCEQNIFSMNKFVKDIIAEVSEAVKEQNEI